jgi:hypothetical protein
MGWGVGGPAPRTPGNMYAITALRALHRHQLANAAAFRCRSETRRFNASHLQECANAPRNEIVNMLYVFSRFKQFTLLHCGQLGLVGLHQHR